MRRLWVGVLVGFLASGVGLADTVYLKNGRTIKGKIVSEDDTEVVLKTPGGRVPLPRKLIKRIERTSAGRTALDMGRQRAREGDYERAREQFEIAANDPDPSVAKQARAELKGLPAGSGAEAGGGSRRPVAAVGDWPPAKNAPLSVSGFRDEFGRPVSSGSIRNKVVLIELASMDHPYSQAFAGGHEKGGFGGVTPQPDVANLQKQLTKYAGVPPSHSKLMVVQLLITGPDGKTPPTVDQASAWAKHFGHTRASNVHLWLGSASHVPAGSRMLGTFMLADRGGLVRLRSRNYPQLFPYIKSMVETAPQAQRPAGGATAKGGAKPKASKYTDDDYGYSKFTNIYPDSLVPPPADAPYPKAIVPLPNPRSLVDIPAKYRTFVNHAMTYAAKGALAKAHAISALKRGGDVSQAQAAYKREVGSLIRAFQGIPRPQEAEMSSARATLLAGMLTQRDLMEKAFNQVQAGTTTYAKIRGWSEVSQQQGNFASVASLMQERFDRMQGTTRQSISTHLGALAGFSP